MNHVLAAAFADDLSTRLGDYDALARNEGTAFRERDARNAIHVLTGVVRAVLADHVVDPHGHCTGCPRRRWRRARGCPVLRDLAQRFAHPAGTRGYAGRHAARP